MQSGQAVHLSQIHQYKSNQQSPVSKKVSLSKIHLPEQYMGDSGTLRYNSNVSNNKIILFMLKEGIRNTPNIFQQSLTLKEISRQIELHNQQLNLNQRSQMKFDSNTTPIKINQKVSNEQQRGPKAGIQFEEEEDVKPNKISTRSPRKTSVMIYISLLNLFIVFIISVISKRCLLVDEWYTSVIGAQNALHTAQKQIAQQGINSITQSTSSCLTPFQSIQLGNFPGNTRGCICPDMTTSEQACIPPCLKLEGRQSQLYNQYEGSQFCVQYGSNALSDIKVGMAGVNSIKIANIHYVLTSKSQNMDFIGFKIAPNTPCYSPNTEPMFSSQLTYPFINRPFVGCDQFGQMDSQVIKLGTLPQSSLFMDNKLTFSGMPFLSKYIKETDQQSLYLIRRPYLGGDDICLMFKDMSFSIGYSYCQMLQVTYMILTYCGMLFFVMSAILMVTYRLIITTNQIKLLNLKFDETLEQSVVTLAISFSFVGVLLFPLYKMLLHSNNSLINLQEVTAELISARCLESDQLNKALKSLNDMSQECPKQIDPFALLIFVTQFLFLIISALSLRKQFQNVKRK